MNAKQKHSLRGKKRQKLSVSKLKNKLWKEVSIYIRNRDADWKGEVACFTCGKRMFWRLAQAGHYISRRYNSTFIYEKNLHPQCSGCNIFRHGAMDDYAVALVKKYGPAILEELNSMKQEDKQWTIPELLELIQYYKKLNRGKT
jgi:hypothetical protein